MSRRCFTFAMLLFFAGLPALYSQGTPQPKFVPKLEPIAETKLIMEGLAHANFRGLEKILNKQPEEEQAWKFARGQALLLAETANLLMLRPPKKEGQNAWFEKATDLRAQASQLAQTVAKKDYEKSRAGLLRVADSCNRCHQSFRVPVLIDAFEGGKKLDVE
jgi:hypothetical protein